LSFAKPKGKKPIKPPRATIVEISFVDVRLPIIMRKMPRNITMIPNGIRSFTP
jgi:hypothetical protein